MKQVLSHNIAWELLCTQQLRQWSDQHAGREFNPQEFRLWYERRDGPLPDHRNCWGAFWKDATRLGIVINTGRTVKAVMPQSNATRLPIYIGRCLADQKPMRRD
jgi:hypothetical protein